MQRINLSTPARAAGAALGALAGLAAAGVGLWQTPIDAVPKTIVVACVVGGTLVVLGYAYGRTKGAPAGGIPDSAPAAPPSPAVPTRTATAASQKLTEVREALREATLDPTSAFVEDQELTYWIEADGSDRVVEKFTTAAVDGGKLAWRRVATGGGPDAQSHASFQEVGYRLVPAERLTLVPIAERERELIGIVFFRPALGSDALAWRVEYVWRGLWDVLRRTRSVSGILQPPVGVRSLLLRLVFPHGTRDAEMPMRNPTVGELRTEQSEDGRPCLVWQVPNPGGQKLNYRVTAELPP